MLLGDAAHTAHFSIGSGTKLAMEDAIGVVQALAAEPDVARAFDRYEAARRPAVERLQELARRSQLWWESFPSRLHIPAGQLMVAYMTRAGNVPLDRLVTTNPDVVASALGQYAGLKEPENPKNPQTPRVPADLTSWNLDRPLRDEGRQFPHRVLAADPDESHCTRSPTWLPTRGARPGRRRPAGLPRPRRPVQAASASPARWTALRC